MSTQSTNYSEPRIVGDGFDALVGGQSAASEGKLWEEVHEEVQRVLAALDEPVRAKVADARVMSGKTRGRGFYLFTYRTYSRTDADLDPIVVGLTFTAANEAAHVVISADISGESGGDAIESLAPCEVPASRDDLLHAANDVARRICERGRSVAEALLDSSRRI